MQVFFTSPTKKIEIYKKKFEQPEKQYKTGQ